MKVTSDELKALYRRRTTRPARERVECLSADMLRLAATGKLSRVERERVADHLVVCSDCAEEYRLIQSLKPWAEQFAESSGEASPEGKAGEKRSRMSRWGVWPHLPPVPHWRAAVVAALFIVGAGAAGVYWRIAAPGREPVQSERGDLPGMGMRVQPLDKAVLQAPPERLAWSAMPSAESYQVVLYDRESTPIWESVSVTGTAVDVPEAVRQRLQPRQPVYWRVVAQTGIERRQSEVFQFVIER